MWRLVLGLVVGCSYTAPPSSSTPSDGAADDSGGSTDGSPDTTTDPDGAAPLLIVTTGLLQDLDADLGVTGTTNVTAWANQVAAGEDVVVTAAGTIALVPDVLNGHAALDFPNTARMEGDDTSVFSDLTDGDGLTWFAVAEPAATQDLSDRNQIFGWIRNGGINSGITAGVDRAARPYAMVRPASTEFKAQSATSVTQWTILAGRLGAGTNAIVQLYRNAATPDAMANSTAANNQVGALTIGAERDDGSEFFDGRIARILIYGRPLDDAELGQTGRALGQRYAIATAF